MTVMGMTIAFAKDISDIEGDAKYGVSTVATKLGARNMTFVVSGVLLLNYLVSISIGIIWPQVFKSNIMILSHAILAFCLIFQTRELALANYASAPSRQFFEFICNNLDELEALKVIMHAQFQLNDLGKLRYFLGLEVVRLDKGIFVSQRPSALQVLEDLGYLGSKPMITPMEANLKLGQDEKEKLADQTLYRRIVGKL
uniref:Uncharacterized protein n=1 Tax=Cannabis sativa TaxID=3483 RepID=A0A803NJ87_CANSA